jgi:hypothetical protein
MSAIGRAILRQAACVALRNATLVGEEVYDSRIGAYDPETFVPNILDIAGSIGVYSEQDTGPALAQQNGGPPFVPVVELVLEIAMQVKFDGDDAYEVGLPATDDQLEMTIDVIETQAEIALFRSQAAASVAFRRLTKQVNDKTSIRFTDPASSTKLAVRYVTYHVEIEDPEIPIFDTSLTGLNRLPEPFKSVVLAWPSDSPEREKATALAALLTQTAMPALEGVDATIAQRDFSSDFDSGGDFSETQTTFTVEIPQT